MNPVPESFVNAVLTQMSVGWMQNPDGFVAAKVFPVIPVDIQGGTFYEFSRADFNRVVMKARGPSTESAGGGWSITPTNYFAEVYAMHKDLDKRLLANFPVFNLQQSATNYLTQQALLHREVDFATRFMVPAVWGTTVAGVAANPVPGQFLQWNNGNSTPVEDIRAGRTAVKLATGMNANKLVLGKRVWDQLVDHPDIVDRIKGAAGPGNPAIVTRQAFAALCELEEVLIMEAVQNTGLENAAEANAFIGGNTALLCHSAASPGPDTPSAGYTFAWKGYLGGSSPVEIETWWMQEIKSWRVEIEAAFVQQRIAAALGYFFNTAVA